MDILLTSYLGIVGLFIGSFLNVILLRHDTPFAWVKGRSHCPHCQKMLTWWELVPVVSYLGLRGRCAGCQARISLQYPLVELLTAALFVSVYLFLAPATPWAWLVFLFSVGFWSYLLIILIYDVWYTIIPNEWVFGASLLAFFLLFFNSAGLTHPTLLDFLAAPLFFLPFFLLWYVSEGRWIGLGDAKLAFALGWFLGLVGGISGIIFAFWIGSIISLVLLAIQRLGTTRLFGKSVTLTMKTEIPFAPFLIAGTALVYFFHLTLLMVIDTLVRL